MLRQLGADYRGFKTLRFRPGLNLIVADTTPLSSDRDSRNSAGKSSIIELLHFLLGARAARNHMARRKELRTVTFELLLDWPGIGTPLAVRRSGAKPETVVLDPDVSAVDSGRLDIRAGSVSVKEWNRLIETRLYHLPPEHPGVSGRTLLSYAMRRIADHGFNEAIRSFARQPEAEATGNLAYLLGLDWKLASRYLALRERENTRRQLRNAAGDPVWGRIVGKSAELRGQIAIAQARIAELRQQVADFRVVPQFEELKTRADQLAQRIRDLGNEDVIDQANFEQLTRAVEETVDAEVEYLAPVYRELGIVLGDQVRQRFDDVRAFHHSVIENRRTYLNQELAATSARLDRRRGERALLGEEQSDILQRLNQGGALQGLTVLQRALAEEEADLGMLQRRLDAARALEDSAREIEAERVELRREVADDLVERQRQTNEVILLFNSYARRLYNDARNAVLVIGAGPGSIRIEPQIDSDESRGIGNMVIFCFDLAVTVLAHRHGRGPDFLVHDSHLFDGVDDRQLASALELAVQVSEQEGLQYIATMNSDDLAKAERQDFVSRPWVLEPRLTDAYENGGLFGFRF